MTRTQIMLDPRQMDFLQRQSQATGKSKSALIRDAIDAFFDQDEDRRRRQEALDRFLSMKWPEATPEVLPRPKDWRERLHDRGPGGRGW
jgi:predicted DNA-binding protein